MDLTATPTRTTRPRILLGVTGSIAAVKAPSLALLLCHSLRAHVKIVVTRTVEQYFWKEGGVTEEYDREEWKQFWAIVEKFREENNNFEMNDEEEDDWTASDGSISVHYAEEEWRNYTNITSPVLHIQLRSWADALVIAPLSAHTLAKIANGLCDDLLTCIVRAWDFGQRKEQAGGGKPVILCPAMNTAMWDHILTRQQVEIVKGFGRYGTMASSSKNRNDDSVVTILEPVVKKLACGDVGAGALAELKDIVACVKKCLGTQSFDCTADLRVVPSSHPATFRYTSQQQTTLSARKESMRKALLRQAKQKFCEMQTTHQHETQQSSQSSLLAAPISPTPNDVITIFLPYLNVGPNSLLVDLGCGDGRWLITAAMLCKCQCLGIDVNEERLRLAQLSIEKMGLSNQITVRKQDVFEFIENDDEFVSKADVFIIYLFRDAMVKIGSALQQRLNILMQGIKILCVGFALPQWRAIKMEKRSGLAIYLYESPRN